MEESSASGGGRGRNKRFWTKEEDKVLVEALSELAVDPHWRCEAGFRNGYMTRLEEDIGKALPGCGLKATPHIDSRLKTLSTKFRAIAQMLTTSGFAWVDERKMISVNRAVYDEFCKDYATGKPAEGFVEAVNNLQKDAPAQVLIDSSDDDVVMVALVPLKLNELASLQAFMKDMNAHLSTMANVMARTDDSEQRADEREKKKMVEKSEQVLEELLSLNLEGVTPSQIFQVANILTAQPNKLMIFSKCPDALKGSYVKSLLGESGDGEA
ncbi:50S ribosomal protein L3 [Bienertia sinuspersici]